jgi:hypothetical protein
VIGFPYRQPKIGWAPYLARFSRDVGYHVLDVQLYR